MAEPRTRASSAARPGRPRDADARRRILAAALRLASARGVGALTMEGIAAEAGVGKATLYRWWPTRADVLLEALRQRADEEIVAPRAATLRADLEGFLRSTFELGRRRGLLPILARLMAEAQLDPGFRERFSRWILESRRPALRAVLERARARGELRAGFDVELGVDLAFGVLWYRALLSHAPVDAALARALAAAIARAAG